MEHFIPLVAGFFVPFDEIERQYGITQETNWTNPDIRPNRFDQNWQNWFARIETYGKVKILYVCPEYGKREYITRDQFLAVTNTPEMLEVYKKYQVEQIKLHKFEFWNRYTGKNGREYKDIIQISVDLLPQLKKGLGWWQKIF